MKVDKLIFLVLIFCQVILSACSSNNELAESLEYHSNEINCAADGVHCKQYNPEL